MNFYHFTSRLYVDDIKRQGLRRGVIPIRMDKYHLNYQWLTVNPDWFPRWASGIAHKYNRSQIRLTISLSKTDRNLLYWPEHGPRLIPLSMLDTLNTGNDPDNWYVYHGVIRPKSILSIDIRPADMVPPTFSVLETMAQEGV